MNICKLFVCYPFIFKLLTVKTRRAYTAPAAPHGQSGLDSRIKADVPPATAAFFTFVSNAALLGGSAGHRKMRRFLDTVVQPAFAALPIGLVRRGLTYHQGVTP